MQKINLRELYPDVYKTDVFVDVAEEVLAAIRGQELNTPPEMVRVDRTNGASRPLKWCMATAAMVH